MSRSTHFFFRLWWLSNLPVIITTFHQLYPSTFGASANVFLIGFYISNVCLWLKNEFNQMFLIFSSKNIKCRLCVFGWTLAIVQSVWINSDFTLLVYRKHRFSVNFMFLSDSLICTTNTLYRNLNRICRLLIYYFHTFEEKRWNRDKHQLSIIKLMLKNLVALLFAIAFTRTLSLYYLALTVQIRWPFNV